MSILVDKPKRLVYSLLMMNDGKQAKRAIGRNGIQSDSVALIDGSAAKAEGANMSYFSIIHRYLVGTIQVIVIESGRTRLYLVEQNGIWLQLSGSDAEAYLETGWINL